MAASRLAISATSELRAGRAAAAGRRGRAGSAANADWQYMAARRVALFIVNSIERGTRWVAVASPHVEVAEAAASQVRAFFEALHENQAFGARRMQEAFFVACDQRYATIDRRGEFHLLIGFAARAKPGFHSFRIVHSASGSKVLPHTLGRLNAEHYSPAELEWVENLARSMSG